MGNITAQSIFVYLQSLVDTPEGKVLYILAVITVLMAVDFVTGSLAAWMNPKVSFNSNTGINGLLRKFSSLVLLVLCIPISVLVPFDVGIVTLYVLYIGYMLLEFTSIIENLDKLGVKVNLFKSFIEKFEEHIKE